MSTQVTIHNKLDQSVELTLKKDDGSLESVRLSPRGSHGPVPQSQCDTPQIQNLAVRGSIKLRPA